MLMSLDCRRERVDAGNYSSTLFLSGFRESARLASCAMVGGAAYGRGRPSDGGQIADILGLQSHRKPSLVLHGAGNHSKSEILSVEPANIF